MNSLLYRRIFPNFKNQASQATWIPIWFWVIWLTHNFSRSLPLHKNIVKCRQSQTSSVSTWMRSDQSLWSIFFLPDQPLNFLFPYRMETKTFFLFVWLLVTFYHSYIFLDVMMGFIFIFCFLICLRECSCSKPRYLANSFLCHCNYFW